MDGGVGSLLAGLAAYLGLSALPPGWSRAFLGAVAIVSTAIFIAQLFALS